MNINFTEAELFAIGCRIDKATKLHDASKTVIITDAIPAVKQIFDTSIHPYQIHLIAISKSLREFFNRNPHNSISFWDCPDSIKWSPHVLVDNELKHIKINHILPSRMLWEFSRKEDCDSIIRRWQMIFQAFDYKGRNFLDLNNDKGEHIRPTYTKGGAWLKHFGLSNSLCAWITRLITNHTSIGEYRLRFFPKESIACPFSNYPIKTRRCLQYTKCWNPSRESIMDILFLEFNSEAFCFQDSISA